MSQPSRRRFLAASSLALLFSSATSSFAAVIRGVLPFASKAYPPEPVDPQGWRYFTTAEAATVEAIVDRLIPPDPQTPGGKECGCAIFIDHQLAGPYGRYDGYYMSGPFRDGSKEQGPQSPTTPAEQYRKALSALDAYCNKVHGGVTFSALSDSEKDSVLGGLESGKIALEEVDGGSFFNLILKDAQQGFLADPIYGGNKNMAGWKMIGFPGARYDYRDWVDKHNQPYPHPPVSIADHPGWSVKS
ncbi:MAG TPA: gluconate 2-dehydrogenase subunit 3 family protein [Beijerinckiaceae bacterium]|nr:gluconate 2-dehydrogenase subunit 3 family protein [Beijerinckiaceae bacterium]